MELSKISTIVRPRNSWQAVDLGFRMAAQWFLPLVSGYLVLTLPIFLLLQYLLPGEQGLIAVFIFWWFKPLWERILLGYLSVRQFGERPTLAEQLKMWRQAAPRQIFATLLWRRFSPQRSYTMAITQLENLTGPRRRKRVIQFSGDNQQAAFWLTIVGMHIEVIITFAIFVLAWALVPTQHAAGTGVFELIDASEFLFNLAGYAAIVLVAPFYIAGGFALYLNQRTQIEGWDIEITFKRMVERQQQLKRRPAGLGVIALLLCSTLLLPTDGFAAADEAQMAPLEQVEHTQDKVNTRLAAEKIVKAAPFHRTETKSYPEFYLDFKIEPDDDEYQRPTELKWLANLLGFFANSVELLLLMVLIAVLIILAIRYRDVLMQFIQQSKNATKTDETATVFGLDIDQQSLPDAPAEVAKDLWQQGEARQALSLLYRSALVELISKEQLTVHDSFTEGECIAQVKSNSPQPIYQYFAELTRQWQRLAYAGLTPDDRTMAPLFEQFATVFAKRSS